MVYNFITFGINPAYILSEYVRWKVKVQLLKVRQYIWGQDILPPFSLLTNFLTPKKKPVPLFSPKSPISNKKRAVFFAIFP